jgi:sugar lactone lactonase YvrE
MDDAKRAPIGQLHRFDGREVHAVGGHCPITNGPAVSPDGGTLYHVDTLGGLVWAFDVATRDHLADGRIFVRIDPADGTPDGVVVDAEGAVWVALWGGWSVRRYAPDGTLLATIAVPAAQVTKVAFGGDDLCTVFVTSANIGLSPKELRAQPEAGSLFSFVSPVPGLPSPAVAIG